MLSHTIISMVITTGLGAAPVDLADDLSQSNPPTFGGQTLLIASGTLSDENRGRLKEAVAILDRSGRGPVDIEIQKDRIFNNCTSAGGTDKECRGITDGKKKDDEEGDK